MLNILFKSFLHRLSHLFKTNSGKVATWQDDDFIYVGFECSVCKQIDPKTINKIESKVIYGQADSNFGSE